MGKDAVLQNLFFAYFNDLILSDFLCGMIGDWLREQGREQEAAIITGSAPKIVVHYTEQPEPNFLIADWSEDENGPWSFTLLKGDPV